MVLTWLTTAQGGAERSTLELARGLRELLGAEVTLVWWDGGDHQPLPPVPGVRVWRTEDAASYARALAGELRRDPDRTVLIGTHRTALVDIPVAEPLEVPVVSVLRGILVPGERLRTADPATGLLVPRLPGELDWTTLARATWVGVSRAATASLARTSPHPVDAVTIYNGIAGAGRPKASAPRRPRRFAVVARTEPWKRIDRVIQAFCAVPDRVASRARLDIYGTGTALPLLRAQAKAAPARDIRFRGHVPAHRWQAAADVLVSACDIEGFGRSVLEAGAAGIPQLVPDRGGSAELVLPGLTGLIHSADEPGGLTAALTEAACWSEQQLQALGRLAQLHARSYSQTRCFLAYARLAQRVRACPGHSPALHA
ncbi:glycosyltransferase family 4 protein [Amycolatopsis albispora]|uniref:Uncharacterized protein n=1 Tax=Amycolatopsis albispora TaxID=1804986 RepID=A0A344L0F4_9PSEU|nr:glycosyltransferase family 4 protein [Amycolatopsis albispora]AXB41528.1 hypothetical protein A4R43_02495 [Amycolatopsis albispora]